MKSYMPAILILFINVCNNLRGLTQVTLTGNSHYITKIKLNLSNLKLIKTVQICSDNKTVT